MPVAFFSYKNYKSPKIFLQKYILKPVSMRILFTGKRVYGLTEIYILKYEADLSSTKVLSSLKGNAEKYWINLLENGRFSICKQTAQEVSIDN